MSGHNGYVQSMPDVDACRTSVDLWQGGRTGNRYVASCAVKLSSTFQPCHECPYRAKTGVASTVPRGPNPSDHGTSVHPAIRIQTSGRCLRGIGDRLINPLTFCLGERGRGVDDGMWLWPLTWWETNALPRRGDERRGETRRLDRTGAVC